MRHDAAYEGLRYPRALYEDDLGILFSSASLKEIASELQTDVNTITEFCDKWGLKINESKTSYTVFTPAGKRKNYERTYKLNIKIKTTKYPSTRSQHSLASS